MYYEQVVVVGFVKNVFGFVLDEIVEDIVGYMVVKYVDDFVVLFEWVVEYQCYFVVKV